MSLAQLIVIRILLHFRIVSYLTCAYSHCWQSTCAFLHCTAIRDLSICIARDYIVTISVAHMPIARAHRCTSPIVHHEAGHMDCGVCLVLLQLEIDFSKNVKFETWSVGLQW